MDKGKMEFLETSPNSGATVALYFVQIFCKIPYVYKTL